MQILVMNITLGLILVAQAASAENRSDVVSNAAQQRSDAFADCHGCPDMVIIPAGTFDFGSPSSEQGRSDDEGPQVRTRLSSFAVSRHEITLDQYRQFVEETKHPVADYCYGMNENGSWTPATTITWKSPGFDQDGDHPVVCVTWNDAMAYIDWINSKVDGQPYRLPTESEWEYTARAGTITPYWWGDEQAAFCQWTNGADSIARERYQIWDRAGTCSDGFLYTAPVGHYQKPNAFGVHDMVGNVWEWVADCYQAQLSNVYFSEQQLASTGCEKRAVRGGAWDYSPLYLRTAYRGAWNPSEGFSNFGFRVARSVN